jgi:nucleoside-diphosphate-sugar epimerase
MNSVLIVGCGFVGNEVIRQCRTENPRPVFALTRTTARVDELRIAGATLIIAVPHRDDSGLGIESHIVGLRNVIQSQKSVRKLIYLSTTGVYGDAHDEVNEATPTQPTRIGPQIAVAAEQWLAERYTAPQLAVIRLAGIYGPGRIPLAEKLRAGEVLQVPQAGWLNLVHVTDIAAMLLKASDNALKQALYVFSDGNPVPRTDFYRTLAKLCGVVEPKFAEPDPTASRSMRAGKKQVNPQRLMNELKLTLQFPSYKEGLANSLRS